MVGIAPTMTRRSPLDIAEDVARQLAFARERGGEVSIVTSVAYPSGRRVGVRLMGGPDTFTVTDDGGTMSEAEMAGGADICKREAAKVAARYGIRFNQWELFEAQAPADRLPGFIIIIANAAAEAMVRTSEKLAERLFLRRKEDLSMKLERLYGASRVEKNVEIFGGSNKAWHFDAQVKLDDRRVGLFELITPAPASVAFGYAKMDDVARLDNPPITTAVTSGRLSSSDEALIRRAALRVISIEAPDPEYLLAA